jgi:uncharacterized protein with HEPN domain
MTDVRNILIHAYDRVSAEILVDVVRQDVPPLLASVQHQVRIASTVAVRQILSCSQM